MNTTLEKAFTLQLRAFWMLQRSRAFALCAFAVLFVRIIEVCVDLIGTERLDPLPKSKAIFVLFECLPPQTPCSPESHRPPPASQPPPRRARFASCLAPLGCAFSWPFLPCLWLRL